MKCGRELSSEQAFCDSCMADMEKYPVKPDTVVKLPSRNSAVPGKKSSFRRRPVLSEKEQIKLLRQRVRRLSVLLAIALLLLAVLGAYTANLLLKDQKPLPGQNYSTVTSMPHTPKE